jgi:hypothetical protein
MISLGTLLAVGADAIYLWIVGVDVIAAWPRVSGEMIHEYSASAAVPIFLTGMAVINHVVADSIKKLALLWAALIGYVVYCFFMLMLLPTGEAGFLFVFPALFYWIAIGVPTLLLAYRSYTRPITNWWKAFDLIAVTLAVIAALWALLLYWLELGPFD